MKSIFLLGAGYSLGSYLGMWPFVLLLGGLTLLRLWLAHADRYIPDPDEFAGLDIPSDKKE